MARCSLDAHPGRLVYITLRTLMSLSEVSHRCLVRNVPSMRRVGIPDVDEAHEVGRRYECWESAHLVNTAWPGPPWQWSEFVAFGWEQTTS